jgi:hypothetical protein
VSDRNGEFAFGLLRGIVEGATRIHFERPVGAAQFYEFPSVAMVVTSPSKWRGKVRNVAFEFCPMSAQPQEVSTCVETEGCPAVRKYIHDNVSLTNAAIIDRSFVSFSKSAMLQALDHTSGVTLDAATRITSNASTYNANTPGTARRGAYLLTLGVARMPTIRCRELANVTAQEAACAEFVSRATVARARLETFNEDEEILLRTSPDKTVADTASIVFKMKQYASRELAGHIDESEESGSDCSDDIINNTLAAPRRRTAYNDESDGSDGSTDESESGAPRISAPRRAGVRCSRGPVRDFTRGYNQPIGGCDGVLDDIVGVDVDSRRPQTVRATLAEKVVAYQSVAVKESGRKSFSKLWVSIEFRYEDDAAAVADALVPPSEPSVPGYVSMRDVLIREAAARGECEALEASLEFKTRVIHQALRGAWASVSDVFRDFVRNFIRYKHGCLNAELQASYGLLQLHPRPSLPRPVVTFPTLSFAGVSLKCMARVLEIVRENVWLRPLLGLYSDEDIKNALL